MNNSQLQNILSKKTCLIMTENARKQPPNSNMVNVSNIKKNMLGPFFFNENGKIDSTGDRHTDVSKILNTNPTYFEK